ncbi:MAG: PepSY domain-containing protein [Thermomicrobiales bacterium]
MSTRRQLIGAGATSLALAALAAQPLRSLADDDEHDDHQVVGDPMLQPAIDLIRAQEIALAENAGAAVTKVELEGEDGVLQYSVHLNNGVDVDIDATTGSIIKTDHDDDHDDHDD